MGQSNNVVTSDEYFNDGINELGLHLSPVSLVFILDGMNFLFLGLEQSLFTLTIYYLHFVCVVFYLLQLSNVFYRILNNSLF